jgi:hypothetical protein
MTTLRLAAAAALALAAAGAAGAAPPRGGAADISCQRIETLPNGGFTYRMQPGLSILALARADGAFSWSHGGEVVGFACLRRGGLPDVEEVEVLQAGYSLAIGAPGRELRLVQLELKEGRVVADMLVGTMEPGDRRRLDAIVAAMQARIDSAPR